MIFQIIALCDTWSAGDMPECHLTQLRYAAMAFFSSGSLPLTTRFCNNPTMARRKVVPNHTAEAISPLMNLFQYHAPVYLLLDQLSGD